MYNSIIVGFLVKIWDLFVLGYEDSLVKKIVDGIKAFISFLFKGSIVKGIFTGDKRIILESKFYKVYSWILEKIDMVLNRLNKYIKKIGNNSIVYNNMFNLFKNEIEIIRTISIFFLFFGIGVIINNIRIGAFAGRSYIISIILILGSLIIINIGNNLNDILNSSCCYNFIKDLFSIDEGGDQWW